MKRTTPVFVYLAILFAAAFLMLLLAFFVQQRNSEITIDDLRTTMTATREDLMEQNQQLQEEKDALEAQVEELTGQAARLQEEKDGLSAELEAARSGDDPVTGEWKNRADVLTCFAIMEQAIREENYEAAAEKVRALCQGGAFELDLGIVNLDGAERFEPRERLAEVIELLVEQEALEEGEVEVP